MKKKPNRVPNLNCKICGSPFYGSPSVKRTTCSMKCRTVHYRQLGNLLTGAKKGAKNNRWKGGRFLHQNKYWLVLKPDHPFHDRHGYVREHRLIMEAHLARYLDPKEVVHHRNGVTTDNRLENLELFPDNATHKRIEHQRKISG